MRNGAWRTVRGACKQIAAEFPSCAPSNLAHLERFVVIVDAAPARHAWLSFQCTWKDPQSRGIEYTLALEIADLVTRYATALTTSVKTVRYIDIRLVGPGGECDRDNQDDLATLLLMFVKFDDAFRFLQRFRRWFQTSSPPPVSLSFENGPLATGSGQSAFWTSQFSELKDLVRECKGRFQPQGTTLYAYEYFLTKGGAVQISSRVKVTLPPSLPETCSLLTSGCSTLTKLEPGHQAERIEADETYQRGLVSELRLQRWWNGLCESAASEFALWLGNWPYYQIDWTTACMIEMFNHLTYHQTLLRRKVVYLIHVLPAPEGGPIDLLRLRYDIAEARYQRWRRENNSLYMIPLPSSSSVDDFDAARQEINRDVVSSFVVSHAWRGFFEATKHFSVFSIDDDGERREELVRVLFEGRLCTKPGYFRRTIYHGRTTASNVLSNFRNYRDRDRPLL